MRSSKLIPGVGLVLLLLLCVSTCMGESQEYMAYKDPSKPVHVRVKDLVNRMTVEEKIGQMAQIDRRNLTVEMMRKFSNFSLGSVLSGGGSVPRMQASAEEWVNMVNQYQKACLETRLGIPMFYGIDAVHGNNNVYKATIFPHNVGLGSTRDPDLVRRIGIATALEMRATGIQYAFAPCIAVCRDPRWGRCYESYSEHPEIVQEMTELVRGLQGQIPANHELGVPFVGGNNKVMACAKHFVGDGGTHKGINENNTMVDWHDLLTIHMPGYYSAIIKGVSTVMASYSSLNGIKMHANRDLLTTFLKGNLRFRGFIISDWKGVDKIDYPVHHNYTDELRRSVQAGVDMIMVPINYTEFFNDMTYLVKKKLVPMDRIDDAVKRILRVKFTMGLFENPIADLSYVKYLGCKEHRELAREAVRKSLVLLKNGKAADTPLLPLPKKSNRILVAGSHANNLGYQCGGWTIAWQGVSGNNATDGMTILNAVMATIDPTTEVDYIEDPDSEYVKLNNYSYAILAVGEPPYAESAGDNLNLTIPEEGRRAISNVCTNVRCVVVLISGRPLVVEPYLSQMDALVAAWLPGSEGQGVADVLYGDYAFSAKTSRTWFRTVDQLPMNVGDSHYDPLFPYGYGLTT